MRFSYIETMTDPAYLGPLAVAAEEAGYDGFVVPDSICYPEDPWSRSARLRILPTLVFGRSSRNSTMRGRL